MTVMKNLIQLIEDARQKGCFSSYFEDETLDAFAAVNGLCDDASSNGNQKRNIRKIEELVRGEYALTSFADEFGGGQSKFTPASVQALSPDDIKEAIIELQDMSPRHDIASYPPTNVGATTEWKCFTGKYSIFAKGYFQAWQGKWLVFVKGYGWCQDIECSFSHHGVRSEIEPYHNVPEQVFIRHEGG